MIQLLEFTQTKMVAWQTQKGFNSARFTDIEVKSGVIVTESHSYLIHQMQNQFFLFLEMLGL